MGIESNKSSRLKGRFVERHREGQNRENHSTAEAIASQVPLLQTAEASELTEPSGIPLTLTLGLRVVQRDNPNAQWEVSRIHGDMIQLLDRRNGATVSKRTDKLREQLLTPGSPWRLPR